MNDSPDRIDQLSPAKRELLELLLKESLDQFPLSFAQQRLWFLHQFDPASALYNLPFAVRLTGQLDVAVLEQSLNAIVERHESLRTTFATRAGEPIQVIAPVEAYDYMPLQVIDLGGHSAAEREASARRALAEQACRPFDLERGPLLAATLWQLTAQEHILLITMHHIVSDGWSINIFVEELTSLYAAGISGAPADLPELPIQYADYAQWQRTHLQGPQFEAQLAYWQGQLGGALPLLNLPIDRPRPPAQSFRGAMHSFQLDPQLARALRELSQHEGVTLFVLLLTAFTTLLHRYSGQTDILVGAPIANRTQAEVEHLIGFFVNTLVLRVDLSGDLRFREALQRVRQVAVEAYDHQDVPFEKLVEVLQPERSLSHTPLFQAMVVFHNTPLPAIRLPGVETQLIELASPTAKFDLTLSITNTEPGLLGSLEYNTDLFDAATIQRMIGHFRTLLASIAPDPSGRLAELPILTAAEQAQLAAWSTAARDVPQHQCIHSLIEAQARRTPDAVAVVFDRPPTTEDRGLKIEDSNLAAQEVLSSILYPLSSDSERHPPSSILHPLCLTYRELNDRANRLAHWLRRLGVSPEARVGICMERSIEMVVGLLGILKAGGAYVPLDPAYPGERLRYMVEDAQVSVLLTTTDASNDKVTRRQGDKVIDGSEAFTPSPPHPLTLSGLSVVDLDADWEQIARQPKTNPGTMVAADNLAYVIYTSGSTGAPKGVQIAHRALVNLITSMREQPGISPADRLLAVTTLSFDIAALELFLPLTAGARLVLIDRETATDGAALGAVLAASEATIMQATPATWRMLLESGWTGTPQLKMLCGGEALPRELTSPLLEYGGSLWNMYGPTETTIWSTLARVGAEPAPITIGRAIANTQIYVLDQHMRPVPAGVSGELYIAGDGLARGYQGRPDLTAERFVPNPFLGTEDRGLKIEDSSVAAQEKLSSILYPLSSTRLYRTGDLARFQPDGALEYLGRIDHQIKLRGFRIEPGEIETVLRRHPSVAESVVLARNPDAGRGEDRPGDRRLVAYIVASQLSVVSSQLQRTTDNGQLTNDLRQFLRNYLPDYMVPTAFVLLDELPRTANGKLDRAALPPAQPATSAEGVAAPRTPVEELIAGIWAAVLGVGRVGLHDNFFALGGHSLLATQVISRVRQVFQVDLPLRRLFEAPTPAGLAASVEALRRAEHQAPALPIRPIAREGSLPLSFAQERLWFLAQLAPGTPFYNIPLAIRITGGLDAAALAQALDAIVRRHEALRTNFAVSDGRPIQVVAPALTLTLPIVDLRERAHAEQQALVARLAREEFRRPFDLARDPLVRAGLLRLDAEEHVLLLTIHHIVSDGWSMGILVRELAALYTASLSIPQSAPLSAQSAPLSALPIQYADYAHWQRLWLREAVLEAQLAYWKNQLDGAPAALALPTDRPRPAVQTFQGAAQPFTIDRELTEALKGLSRQASVTLFMTLLAAFNTLLFRYTGSEDIVVGSPIANRNRAEIEGLIGFFVNALALRTDLSGSPTFRTLLERVREITLDAYAHQDLPFERLVEELQPARDPSRHPLFLVAFALQNAPRPVCEIPGLTFHALDSSNGTTKFDLSLVLIETPEGLAGTLEYSTDLFEAATIERMVGHFKMLLAAIAEDHALPVSALPILTEAERQQLLVEWNATDQERRLEIGDWRISDNVSSISHLQSLISLGGIHALFEAQAARAPDAIAIVDHRPPTTDHRQDDKMTRWPDDKMTPHATRNTQHATRNTQHATRNTFHASVTYAELNRRANQLAHYLRAAGVGPEVNVGICVERSLEMVVGLLGILKAGGAYVPLDPTYPAERLQFMLEDARVSVLLTSREIRDWRLEIVSAPQSPISNLQSPTLIYLDTDWEQITTYPATDPDWEMAGDNLAYVIYTSGTTGRPKGVAVTHGGLLNLVCWHQRHFELTASDRATQLASLSFDAAAWELWPYLAIGAGVHLVPPDLAVAPVQLRDWLLAHQITVSFLPTPLLEQIVGLDWPPTASLRLALTGGDVLHRYPPAGLPFQLVNNYGPTENTVVTTSALIAPHPQEPGRRPAIGRPIANVQLYILDAQMQPVPIGVPGELYIGGAQLARGYLGRPGLTAERFVPCPLSVVSGPLSVATDNGPLTTDNRLYRSGDLARYRPDGQIEFLGRIDTQVKLRGFRIELAEIEAVLCQHPAVREAVVVVRNPDAGRGENVLGESRLMTYIVPTTEDRGLKIEDSNLAAQEKLSSILYPLSSIVGEQVENWQQVFDTAYHTSAAQPDPAFNIVGWHSSYTGQPIPAAEMREWVDQTVRRILALRPQRVLEIGCGTGLLLFQIAPQCAAYCGTDFSQAALDHMRRHLAAPPHALAHVTLAHQRADDLSGFEPASFDTVILNSVAQYFPDIDYLVQVLAGALRVTGPGGAIFLGDLRSLPLLEAFHASVELQRAPDTLATAALCQRIRERVAQEQELAVDPDFFSALRRQFPQISHVAVQLKRGRYANELSRFRYDVTLHIGTESPPAGAPVWLDWQAEDLSLAAVRDQLADLRPGVLGITGVPNPRVIGAVRALELLAGSAPPATVGALRHALQETDPAAGVDPEVFWSFEDQLPYNVTIAPQPGRVCCYQVVCTRRDLAGTVPLGADSSAQADRSAWSAYANNPLRRTRDHHLIATLRNYLKQRLPSFMLPSSYVLLDGLPLTANGKVDRQALVPPDSARSRRATAFVAPRSATEEILAQIWAGTLGIEQVGIDDNFFELGGHSLLATLVASRIREAFKIELPLLELFEQPTIAGLARLIENAASSAAESPQPALVRRPRTRTRVALSSQGKLTVAQDPGQQEDT